MARLEDEFRHVLSSRAVNIEIDALADLSSLSINSDRSNSASSADLPAAGDDEEDAVSSTLGRGSSSAYRSLRSIREIDLCFHIRSRSIRSIRAASASTYAAKMHSKHTMYTRVQVNAIQLTK
jgi:exocyst complex component 7